MNFLLVDLYNDFQCIGSACPDTCCEGWTIIIDEETYQKMEEQETVLETPVTDWIMKKDGNRIIRLDHFRCPMLDEENLCKVVSRLGSEYLSKTCARYPRVYSQYGNVIEGYLAFSCPEVVNRLMNKTELQFDYLEDEKWNFKGVYPYEQLYLYEATARIAMVDVFQNPVQVALHTRVALAFDILEKAIEQHMYDQANSEELKKSIDWYLQGHRLDMMEKGLNGIVNESTRYHFLQKIQFLLDINHCSERFERMIRQMYAYFAKNDLEQYLKDIRNFRYSQRAYEDFHIRYWVYRIFSDILIIPAYEKARESFMCIAAGFCITQMMALVIYASKGVLKKEEYIYIISNISRKMEHNQNFKEQLVAQLDANDINGLAGLLLMII